MGRDGYPWWRSDKRCYYVWHEGRQVRLHPDRDEAFASWHALIASANAAPTLTVASLVGDYLATVASRVSPATLAVKRRHLDRVVALHGREDAETFDAPAYSASVAAWSVATRWLVLVTIRTAWREAGVAAALTWRVTSMPSRASRQPSADAVRALLDAASPRYASFLHFLYLTGCRPSEALTLRREDVAGGVAVVRGHKTAHHGRQRVLILTDDAASLAASAVPFGVRYDGARKHVSAIRRRLALPSTLTLYSLRHAYATDALVAGVPDATVAALLGHASTAMLHRHYNHLTERVTSLRDAASRVRPTLLDEAT